VECESHRECGDREAGLDWGVETFATLAYAPGEYAEEENDRPLAAEQEALKTESRALSKALRGQARHEGEEGARAPASPRGQPPQGPQPSDHRAPRARPQADRDRGAGTRRT